MEALGWVDPSSPILEWDLAQVRRLARQLGYTLRWADPGSVLGLVEQVEASGAEAVMLSSSAHVDVVTLDRLMSFADVECAASVFRPLDRARWGAPMIVLGWVTVVGIPLIVFIAAILWPERIPKDRTVEAIRQRVESEDQRNRHGDDSRRQPGY